MSISIAECARASLAEWLNAAPAALDGFPIEDLLDVYMSALEGGTTAPERAATLIDCILENWISGLRTEIAILVPNSTELTELTELIATTGQQLADTQGALVRLQTRFRELERCRIEGADEWSFPPIPQEPRRGRDGRSSGFADHAVAGLA